MCGTSPGSSVRVSVPGLLLHSKGSLRQDGAEPGRDVFADVVDLVGVLTRAPGAVLVGLVLQDLHAAALAAALLPAFFLHSSEKPRERREMFMKKVEVIKIKGEVDAAHHLKPGPGEPLQTTDF